MKPFVDATAVEQIKDFRLPKYEEIPNVGLFLEQVVKYVNEFLEPLGNVSLTGSMISNYVKKNLIANPIKKLYYRDHIIYVLFIAIAKSVLSLEELETLINNNGRKYDHRFLYEYFSKEFQNILFYAFGINDEYEETELSPGQYRYLLRNTIITASHKIYLDIIFQQEIRRVEKNTTEKSS